MIPTSIWYIIVHAIFIGQKVKEVEILGSNLYFLLLARKVGILKFRLMHALIQSAMFFLVSAYNKLTT